jgi:hypothetical protein
MTRSAKKIEDLPMRTLVAVIAAVAALGATAFAIEFGPAPTNYEAEAEAYIATRVEDPNSLRVQFRSAPYQVYANVSGYEGLPCWAVDVRVKTRRMTGEAGVYVPYTVLFLDGTPIALKDDAQRITRL